MSDRSLGRSGLLGGSQGAWPANDVEGGAIGEREVDFECLERGEGESAGRHFLQGFPGGAVGPTMRRLDRVAGVGDARAAG